MDKTKTFRELSHILLILLIVLNVFTWYEIVSAESTSSPRLYFLNVGQGDAELLSLPSRVNILTDAGPGNAVLGELEKVLGSRRYIDLALMSHPQLDHFNGFNYLLDKYRFGAVAYNGRDDTPGVSAWPELLNKLHNQKIPTLAVGAGDLIRYGNSEIRIISPDKKFLQSAELNDTGLVELIKTPEFKVLLAADIGFNVENYLMSSVKDLNADILKIAHHGSKYSSSLNWLEAVKPKIAVIEVGRGNTYGHPTSELLGRLKALSPLKIFRTDENGSIEIRANGQISQVFTEKSAAGE